MAPVPLKPKSVATRVIPVRPKRRYPPHNRSNAHRVYFGRWENRRDLGYWPTCNMDRDALPTLPSRRVRKFPPFLSDLRILRAENIVVKTRRGKHIDYSLADRHIGNVVKNVLEHASEPWHENLEDERKTNEQKAAK